MTKAPDPYPEPSLDPNPNPGPIPDPGRNPDLVPLARSDLGPTRTLTLAQTLTLPQLGPTYANVSFMSMHTDGLHHVGPS